MYSCLASIVAAHAIIAVLILSFIMSIFFLFVYSPFSLVSCLVPKITGGKRI